MRRLNVGCGRDLKPAEEGWTNLDARGDVGADVVGPADVLPFEDEVFDEVLAHDVLEHLPKDRTLVALREWRRVLRPGGVLRICTPNLDRIARAWVDGRIPATRFESLIFGGRDYPENQHLVGFTPALLSQAMHDAGFSVVRPWKRSEPVSEFNQCVEAVR